MFILLFIIGQLALSSAIAGAESISSDLIERIYRGVPNSKFVDEREEAPSRHVHTLQHALHVQHDLVHEPVAVV